jgi:hypothetical protein
MQCCNVVLLSEAVHRVKDNMRSQPTRQHDSYRSTAQHAAHTAPGSSADRAKEVLLHLLLFTVKASMSHPADTTHYTVAFNVSLDLTLLPSLSAAAAAALADAAVLLVLL